MKNEMNDFVTEFKKKLLSGVKGISEASFSLLYVLLMKWKKKWKKSQ